ncbi:MAG: flavodoxin domain-containing protein [Candidatus Nanoarchaeia archaeon]|nr:flavodoxin domain-containing protein [Candidatus Nanoarchaeia archaeon]
MNKSKTAIVYNSVYGSTKKYAEWLHNELKYIVFEIDKVKPEELAVYTSLIVMSGVYGAKMPAVRFLKNNWDKLKEKKIILIAVGMAPEGNWWDKLTHFLIPQSIKKRIKYFKIQGKYKEQGEIKKEHLDRIIKYILKQ